MATIRIRLNVPMLGFPAGTVTEIPVDQKGDPTQLFWIRRMRDARKDGCLTIVQDDPAAAPAQDVATFAAEPSVGSIERGEP